MSIPSTLTKTERWKVFALRGNAGSNEFTIFRLLIRRRASGYYRKKPSVIRIGSRRWARRGIRKKNCPANLRSWNLLSSWFAPVTLFWNRCQQKRARRKNVWSRHLARRLSILTGQPTKIQVGLKCCLLVRSPNEKG